MGAAVATAAGAGVSRRPWPVRPDSAADGHHRRAARGPLTRCCHFLVPGTTKWAASGQHMLMRTRRSGRGLLAAGRDIGRAIWDARAPALSASSSRAVGPRDHGPRRAWTPRSRRRGGAGSASCSQGDIEIILGHGRRPPDPRFSAEEGRDLQKYDVRVYSTHHEDREYILSQTTQPPSAGPIIAVHVTYLDAAAARDHGGPEPGTPRPPRGPHRTTRARDRSFGAPTPSRWPTTEAPFCARHDAGPAVVRSCRFVRGPRVPDAESGRVVRLWRA